MLNRSSLPLIYDTITSKYYLVEAKWRPLSRIGKWREVRVGDNCRHDVARSDCTLRASSRIATVLRLGDRFIGDGVSLSLRGIRGFASNRVMCLFGGDKNLASLCGILGREKLSLVSNVTSGFTLLLLLAFSSLEFQRQTVALGLGKDWTFLCPILLSRCCFSTVTERAGRTALSLTIETEENLCRRSAK